MCRLIAIAACLAASNSTCSIKPTMNLKVAKAIIDNHQLQKPTIFVSQRNMSAQTTNRHRKLTNEIE